MATAYRVWYAGCVSALYLCVLWVMGDNKETGTTPACLFVQLQPNVLQEQCSHGNDNILE